MFFANSARMNHLSRVGKTHSIAPAVRHNNGTLGFVRFVARPVALEFQKQLYPACKASTGLFQSAKGEFVAGRGQATARICNDENFKSIFESREHGKGHARLSEESDHN
jgi:hypothetical protein